MKLYCGLILFFLWPISMIGLTVGSNTAVARQAVTLFPAAGTDNEMKGFGRFSNGFTLADNNTSCTFNSIFPVSGPIKLNGGVLYLKQDLVINNTVQIYSLGRIWGNGLSVEISSTAAPLVIPLRPSSPMLLNEVKIVLGSPVHLRAGIECWNNCVINGRGNELRFLSGGSINVKPGGSLILEDLILTGLSASNLGCYFGNSSLMLRNCCLQFSSDFTFSIGSIAFDQNVYFNGPSTFNYTTASASTINSNSTLYLENGTTFKYAPAAANKNLIVMQDSTASLFLDGSTLFCTTTGLRLTTGSLYFHNGVTLTNEANNLAQGMEFGANLSINFLSKSFVNLYGSYKYGT